MKNLILLMLVALTIISCKNKTELEGNRNKVISQDTISEIKENMTTAQEIAYASGFEDWNTVSQLNFTFNVDRGGEVFSRSWRWYPKSNKVTMMTAKDTVTYNRSSMDSIAQKTDQAFINDKYWLHAPFNLVLDEGTTISESEKAEAPISKDTLQQITIAYNDSLGYTPGDAYDIYYDSDFMIREWIYRKGNAEKPSMVTTWEDYKNFDGIKLATMHQDSTGTFKLYFTDVSLKTEKTNSSK